MNTSHGVYADTDLLTWVGGRAYPTIDAFVQESLRQGISRRLPGLSPWIVPGKTRVFLAHKNGLEHPAYASLFGYFTVHSTHLVYDDISCGPKVRFESCRPVLKPKVKAPKNRAEFDGYILLRKIVIVLEEKAPEDPLADLLEDLWKEWLKDAIKKSITQDGVRHIPWSDEPDLPERLCGGANPLGSGRYPGAYLSDELGDWLLDQILDMLLDEPDLDESYFWEEEIIEERVVRVRRKVKRPKEPGASRSGRVTLERVQERYGEPPSKVSRLVVFEKPYPLYYHPPKAAFRGFQRIDGDSLLLKLGLEKYIPAR